MAEENLPDLTTLADRDLLERVRRKRDAAAFAELVARHGPLVLSVCRRGTPCEADADDAFQATFLVLAASAHKIRRSEAVASWLYGVAARIGARMRHQSARRSAAELLDVEAPMADPLDELLARHDETVADEELNALPESLRAPLVLRYLAGKSNAETARELGLSIAALEGRLKRGKQRLRMRLLRRGVTLASLVAVLKGSRVAAAEIEPELVTSCVEAFAADATATLASAEAGASTQLASAELALEEISAMSSPLIAKPAALVMTVIAATTLAVAAPLASSQIESGTGEVNLHAAALAAPAAPSNPMATQSIEPARADPQPAPAGDRSVFVPAGGQAQLVEWKAGNVAPAQSVRGAGYGSSPSPAQPQPQPVATDSAYGETRVVRNSTSYYDRHAYVQPQFDKRNLTWSEERIEQALARPLTDAGLDFTETPLEEVAEFLRDEFEVEIQLDALALDNEGVSPGEPVTVNLKNIRLESALRLMLAPLHATYVMRDEVLLITSQAQAAATMETRVYSTERLDLTEGKFEELLRKVVSPSEWVDQGGEATIHQLSQRVVIRAPYHVHREVGELLVTLIGKPERPMLLPGQVGPPTQTRR